MSGFDDLVTEAMPYLATEHITAAKGSSWEWSYKLTDATGTAVDFTGCTGVCELRPTIGGAVALAPTVTFAAGGYVKITATPTQTAALVAGRYLLELELANAAGRKVKVVGAGDAFVTVKPEVTL